MMALVNTTGVHVPLWLTSPMPEIGWGQNASYPDMEGAFFGNIFVVDSSGKVPAYFCEGETHLGLVPGRIGADQTDSPYQNPWGDGGLCSNHCSTSGVPRDDGQTDGFSSCKGYAHVITVWRNADFKPQFDPDTKYSIKNLHSGKVIDWDQSSALVQQWTDYSKDNQLWKFASTDGASFHIMSAANQDRCLAIAPKTDSVSKVQLATCVSGSKDQNWVVDTTDGRSADAAGQFFKFHSAALSDRYLEVPGQSDSNGTGLTADGFGPSDNEIWRLGVGP
jgi:hypothetical protein